MPASRLLSFFATLVTATLVACGGDGDDRVEPVRFQRAEAELISTSMNPGLARLALTAEDDAFYGPANRDEKVNSLFLSMRSEDDLVWVSVEVLDVEARDRHDLDSLTQGRLTLLLGESCDGGMGDLVGAGCRWYSSDFYQANCHVDVDRSRTVMDGRVVCGALGANCPSGTGIRGPDGACLDGEKIAPISLSLRFSLRDPIEISKLTQTR